MNRKRTNVKYISKAKTSASMQKFLQKMDITAKGWDLDF